MTNAHNRLSSANSTARRIALSRSFGASPILKRLFDICVAAVLMIVLLPLIALTALVVLIVLGRPLIFRQPRCGRGRKSFLVGKFRTMRAANVALLTDEQRQTISTAILRRFRVDELPQLFAVLNGDMSFVGPRPLQADAIAAFGAAGEIRCSLAPGLTGWAQVNGNTLLTNSQKIALDLWYVDQRSIWLDVKIVFMTIRTILVGETVNQRNIDHALAAFQATRSTHAASVRDSH